MLLRTLLVGASCIEASADHLVEVRRDLHCLCDQVAEAIPLEGQQLGVGDRANRRRTRQVADDRNLSVELARAQ
jgi:hypothetical protein